jgi:glucose/mannose transport system permease protein
MSADRIGTSRIERWLPQLVVSPAFVFAALFFYGLAAWIIALSLTPTRGRIVWQWGGLEQYGRLFADEAWRTSLINLALFLPLAIGIPLILGALLAVLLDQHIRGEGPLRTMFLYPLALSWIVSGTLWLWMLRPDIGIESFLKRQGFPGASFDWVVDSNYSIYAVALVAIWHSTGFVMAMFVAGLRSIDESLLKAARIDGASLPRAYWSIILPALRPTVFSALLILLPAMIKTYDLVVVLTQGGPGHSSMLPAVFAYERFFARNQMGLGAAAGTIILMLCVAIAVPYILSELGRQRRHEG